MRPSAIRAQSKDSIAPSNASVKAGATMYCALSQLTGSHSKEGSPEGMPPKRLPIVSTGKLNTLVTIVATTMATTVPGRCDSHPRRF